MDDKLVTLVTLTYNKALILKGLLAKEGVDAYISNLHTLEPIVSSGVRVRIKERDLPQALKVTESTDWLSANVVGEKPVVRQVDGKEILIPVDFSEYSMRVCEMAFHIASRTHFKLTLFHVYTAPVLHANLPYTEALNLPLGSDKESRAEEVKDHKELDTLTSEIKKRIVAGELPDVPFTHVLKEGIPEEEILRYAKDNRPTLIIMGTRGRHRKDVDFLGSVTAEVIERSKSNVLAIPENTPIKDFSTVKHIAFITNFEQYDLIAFDGFIKLWGDFKFSVTLLHLAGTPDKWNEIKLAGIKEYFHRQYPSLEIHYDVVKNDDLLKSLDHYIKEKQIDVMTLTSRKRNVFARLFNPSIAQRMIFHSDTPLMVINMNSFE